MKKRLPLPCPAPLSSLVLAALLACLLLAGCAPKIKLFSDASDPLEEYVLEGEATEKILLLNASGTVSDEPRSGLLGSRPSMVQEIVSQLRLAEKDEDVRAVVLKINSPGGGVTASDVLHHELSGFNERTGKPVVALLMDLAASGGYYIALPAKRIVAHPTTVTGSVGAIFFMPRVTGLMNLIGVDVEVAKSGRNKDMASPFRAPTEEERQLADALILNMGERFQMLVREARNLGEEQMRTVATARVFTADQALELGLVDRIGYLQDAYAEARELAGLPEDARVVVYRRENYPNDTAYNASAMPAERAALVQTGLENLLPPTRAGVYYLWLPQY
ncbi:MAG: signal peptide peptidase SppA [Desulfovibrionaceae bacterium]